MKAQQLHSFNGPDALRLLDIEVPRDPDKVLIAVHAAGVSYPDLLFTYGRYQDVPELPYTPGLEVAGLVESAPENSGFQRGDRVAAYTFSEGGYAEYALASPQFVFKIPESLEFSRAAASVVNYHTAHFSLRRRARLSDGETVLIHGAAGGLGSAAVQVAKGFGCTVIALASSEHKLRIAAASGADVVLPLEDGWVSKVRAATDGRGVDLVYDPVGGPEFVNSLRSLAPDGRVVVVGFASGEIPTVKLNRLLLGNTSVMGAVWQPFIAVEPEIIEAAARDLADMTARGVVRPVVGSRYPLGDAPRALKEIEERRAAGKVVLDVVAD
jgi:NADPH2:quinone reductase